MNIKGYSIGKYAILTIFILFVSFFAAFSWQLPAKSQQGYYFKSEPSQELHVASINEDNLDIDVFLDLRMIHRYKSDETSYSIMIYYIGNHNNEFLIPHVTNFSVKINGMELDTIWRFKTTPPQLINSDQQGRYDRIQTIGELNKTKFVDTWNLEISVDVGLYEYDSLNDTSPDKVRDLNSYSENTTIYDFNKTIFMIIAAGLIALLLLVLYREFTKPYTTDDEDAYERLLFTTVLFPNAGMTFGFFLLSPLGFRQAWGAPVLYINSAESMINTLVTSIPFTITWIFVIPMIVDWKTKWLDTRDINSELKIHSNLLKNLDVKKESSENSFYRITRKEAIKRIFFATPAFLLIHYINLFSQPVTSLSFFVVPIVYYVWVWRRPSLLDQYKRENIKNRD